MYKSYPYPYYADVNTPIYNSVSKSKKRQRKYQQVFEAILAAIKREASAIDIYSRLAHAAPNQKHKNNILRILENKKVHLQQFMYLYTTLTGSQPVYQIDQVTFHSYREGLQKAYETEVGGCDEYQKSYLLTKHPLVRNVFFQAVTDKKENAKRLGVLNEKAFVQLKDYGSNSFVINIEEAAKQNNTFRTAIWTGNRLQVTVMSINAGDDIGLEVHPEGDQFIRIEEGQGLVQMGDSKDNLDFEEKVYEDYAIMIPAGKWHNLTNTGNKPLKVYVIYAPPEHPYGTVHETKAIAEAAEENH